jgi:hypothetical protein
MRSNALFPTTDCPVGVGKQSCATLGRRNNNHQLNQSENLGLEAALCVAGQSTFPSLMQNILQQALSCLNVAFVGTHGPRPINTNPHHSVFVHRMIPAYQQGPRSRFDIPIVPRNISKLAIRTDVRPISKDPSGRDLTSGPLPSGRRDYMRLGVGSLGLASLEGGLHIRRTRKPHMVVTCHRSVCQFSQPPRVILEPPKNKSPIQNRL